MTIHLFTWRWHEEWICNCVSVWCTACLLPPGKWSHLCDLPVHFVSFMHTLCQSCTVCVSHAHFVSFLYTLCHSCTICVLPVHFVSFMHTLCPSCTLCVIHAHFVSVMYSLCLSCTAVKAAQTVTAHPFKHVWCSPYLSLLLLVL